MWLTFHIDMNNIKLNICVIRFNKLLFLARPIITKWNKGGRKKVFIANVFKILECFVFNLYKRIVSHGVPTDHIWKCFQFAKSLKLSCSIILIISLLKILMGHSDSISMFWPFLIYIYLESPCVRPTAACSSLSL